MLLNKFACRHNTMHTCSLFISFNHNRKRIFFPFFPPVFRSDLLFLLRLRIFFVFPQPYFAKPERSYFMRNNNNAINPILADLYRALRKRLPNYHAAETKLIAMAELLVYSPFFMCIFRHFPAQRQSGWRVLARFQL